MEQHGTDRMGRIVSDRHGRDRIGRDWQGPDRQERLGGDRQGQAGIGQARKGPDGQDRPGSSRTGNVTHGLDWIGRSGRLRGRRGGETFMRFYWLSRRVKLERKAARLDKWHMWFAWYPVMTLEGHLVWLEKVQIRADYYPVNEEFVWEYRLNIYKLKSEIKK